MYMSGLVYLYHSCLPSTNQRPWKVYRTLPTLFKPLFSKLPKLKCDTQGHLTRVLCQAFLGLWLVKGSQLWYKQHRPLGICGVCITIGVTRLRLVTPQVYHIHHSFLGIYLSHIPSQLSITYSLTSTTRILNMKLVVLIAIQNWCRGRTDDKFVILVAKMVYRLCLCRASCITLSLWPCAILLAFARHLANIPLSQQVQLILP